jgi:hypothetical protein
MGVCRYFHNVRVLSVLFDEVSFWLRFPFVLLFVPLFRSLFWLVATG